LFIASWYPNKEDPLSGIFIRRHAEALSRYCDVSVLYLHYDKKTKESRIEVCCENGVLVFRAYFEAIRALRGSRYPNALFTLSHFFAILSHIKKSCGTPDIVHANVIYPAGLLGLVMKRIYQVPLVLTEHQSPFSVYLSNRPTAVIAKRVMEEASAILPVSTAQMRDMKNLYDSERYLVVPNVVNTEKFKPGQAAPGKKCRVVHISTMDERFKNVCLLLQSVKRLSKQRSDFEVNIVGDGKDRRFVEEYARRLQLGDEVVHFTGRLSEGQVAQHMQSSQFLVLSSNKESFSVVCAEAISCGIPVVCTKCGGPEDYVSDKVGRLVEPRNGVALTDAIDWMIDHHSDFDPDVLHEYARQRFSYESVGRRIFGVYQSILSKQDH
jgi:glycosyltransferase involved in cell wall biosynthesis